MKILPVLLTQCCIALLCLSLTSCSSHNKKFASHRGGVQEANLEDEVSASEPEESAGEELAALQGLSAEQRITLEQAGIDAKKYDFPIVLNDQVQYYLDLFQGKQRGYYSRWLARSTAFRPHIEAELKKAGLPKDLVFLAMIESGYNPAAYSPANACGLWQFIAGTGKRYGLKIDPWIDERREPTKATQAAIGYLSKLHRQFDDWYLAVAAYNTGEGRIADAIDTYSTKNFWEIADTEGLYLETKRYVPKLIAAIIIGRDPERYGFTDIAYQAPQRFEQISVPGGVSLEAVATTANTTVKELRTLNNELRKNQTPPTGRYTLRIPVGTRELVAANIDNLKPISRTVYATHTVKRGDTLSEICRRYNVSMTNILKANNLRTATLRSGQRLQIPTTSTQYVLAKQDAPSHSDQGTKTVQQSIRHQLKSKENLASVARQYKISVKDLMRWNKISNQKKIKQGQQLTVFVERKVPTALVAQAPKSAPKTIAAKKTAVVLAAAKKQSVAPKTIVTVSSKSSKNAVKSIPTVTVAKAPQKSTSWYVVQNGDTLSTIARRFSTSAQDLRKWNKLS
ncbi:MAG: LysM peptidoglycan-binding domain-containing protein, partial [Desulfobulbus sp.]|nr:LysM peptidoglycan-binding domain-containing protein [Desulfobulbus sp.]